MLGEKKMTPNTVFCDSDNSPICTGWLPEGFSTSASIYPDKDSSSAAPVIWAKAADSRGREWFNRIFKKYRYSKKDQKQENPFMMFDEYLDTNAVRLLDTRDVSLVRRYPLTDPEMDDLRKALEKNRDSIYSMNRDGFQYIIQGIYGGSGTKLYRSHAPGNEKYLVLTVRMYASEYGVFNKQIYENEIKTQQMLNNMRMGIFGGRTQIAPPPMPQFDTDPSVPFGQHSARGFTSAEVIWDIHDFAGFVSPTEPDENEIREFLCFVRSLELHESFKRFMNQVNQQIMMNNMMSQQMIFNSMQQTIRTQQQCAEKSFNAIKSVSDFSDQMLQHRMAVDNAALDHSVRMNHEAVMGVDTYQRSDGSTVEYSTSADRVFQAENDPSVTVGVSGTGPEHVPFGWTELEKLK